MKWPARLVLLGAALATPAYLLLDARGWVPVAVRDRPWPFALVAVVLSLVAMRLAPRLRILALTVALVSPLALAGAAHLRYRLPPSSPRAGVGEPLPDLELPDQSGHQVRLHQLGDRPVMLIWFRGSWCPYCRRQLTELTDELRRFSGAGLQLYAVSNDPPEPLAKMKEELHLPFALLSDPERRLVNRCELGHCVAILDSSGVVRWAVVSGNWEKDLPARALLQALYRQN